MKFKLSFSTSSVTQKSIAYTQLNIKKDINEEGIIKYERKDDMLFGEWQAQMMLEKGQTTEGVRVDKKIVINPLFKGINDFKEIHRTVTVENITYPQMFRININIFILLSCYIVMFLLYDIS